MLFKPFLVAGNISILKKPLIGLVTQESATSNKIAVTATIPGGAIAPLGTRMHYEYSSDSGSNWTEEIGVTDFPILTQTKRVSSSYVYAKNLWVRIRYYDLFIGQYSEYSDVTVTAYDLYNSASAPTINFSNLQYVNTIGLEDFYTIDYQASGSFPSGTYPNPGHIFTVNYVDPYSVTHNDTERIDPWMTAGVHTYNFSVVAGTYSIITVSATVEIL